MQRNKVIVHNRLDLKSLRRAMCNHNHQKSYTLETEAARAFSMFVFNASVLTHTSAVVYFLWGFPVSFCLSVCLLLSCSSSSFHSIDNCIIAIMSLYMYFFWQSKHQALNLKTVKSSFPSATSTGLLSGVYAWVSAQTAHWLIRPRGLCTQIF